MEKTLKITNLYTHFRLMHTSIRDQDHVLSIFDERRKKYSGLWSHKKNVSHVCDLPHQFFFVPKPCFVTIRMIVIVEVNVLVLAKTSCWTSFLALRATTTVPVTQDQAEPQKPSRPFATQNRFV